MGRLEKRIFKKYFWLNALTIITIFIYMGIHIYIQMAFVSLFDAVLAGELDVFTRWGVVLLGLMVGLCIFQFISQTMIAKSTQKMNMELRHQINKNIANLSYQSFHEEEIGTYVSWLSNDVKQVEESTFEKFFDLCSNIATCLFTCVALFSLHYSLLLTALISALILMFTPSLLKRRMQKNATDLSESQEAFMAQIKDTLCGFGVMRNYNLMSLFLKRLDDSNKFIEKRKFIYALKYQKYLVVIMFFNFVAQMSCNFVGATLAILGLAPASAFVALGALSGSFCNAVGGVAQTLMSLTAGRAIISKFEVEEVSAPVGQKIMTFDSTIELEDLSYDYDGKQVFSNVNVAFEKGKKYAIVGPSGCGKSTLLKIIMGDLEDFNGHVTIDNVDIKDYDKNSIYENLAYISQDIYLFDATIKDNITLFSEEVDETRLNEVLESSALSHEETVLERLNETVGESGKNLSGGQRQRIAIARALFNDKSVIIMDEGTSALDKENARLIEEKLLTNKDLTLILVTHHMNENLKEHFDGIYDMETHTISALSGC